jgi:hypothetical protein
VALALVLFADASRIDVAALFSELSVEEAVIRAVVLAPTDAKPMSHVEGWVPFLFAAAYVAAFVIAIA